MVQLEVLDLSRNNIGDEGMKSFSSALATLERYKACNKLVTRP
jgi:hypothetical protein